MGGHRNLQHSPTHPSSCTRVEFPSHNVKPCSNHVDEFTHHVCPPVFLRVTPTVPRASGVKPRIFLPLFMALMELKVPGGQVCRTRKLRGIQALSEKVRGDPAIHLPERKQETQK